MPTENGISDTLRRTQEEARKREEQARELQRIRGEYQQQLQMVQQLRTQNQQLIKQSQEQNQKLDGQIKQLVEKNQSQTKIIEELLKQKEVLVELFSNQFKQLNEDNQKLSALLNVLGNPLNEFLLRFAQEGDLNKVKASFILGADLEARDKQGMTPIYLSLLHDHFEIAKFLIAFKAKLEINTKESMLNLICSKGSEHAVKFLLDNLPQQDEQALISAYEQAATTKIKEKIADNLFLYAITKKDKALIEKALGLGANINAEDKNKETALEKARIANSQEIIDFLQQKSNKSTNQKGLNSKHFIPSKESSPESIEAHHRKEELAVVLQSQVRGFFARKNFHAEKLKQNVISESGNILEKLLSEKRYEEMEKLLKVIRSEQYQDAKEIINRVNSEDTIDSELGTFMLINSKNI